MVDGRQKAQYRVIALLYALISSLYQYEIIVYTRIHFVHSIPNVLVAMVGRQLESILLHGGFQGHRQHCIPGEIRHLLTL